MKHQKKAKKYLKRCQRLLHRFNQECLSREGALTQMDLFWAFGTLEAQRCFPDRKAWLLTYTEVISHVGYVGI